MHSAATPTNTAIVARPARSVPPMPKLAAAWTSAAKASAAARTSAIERNRWRWTFRSSRPRRRESIDQLASSVDDSKAIATSGAHRSCRIVATRREATYVIATRPVAQCVTCKSPTAIPARKSTTPAAAAIAKTPPGTGADSAAYVATVPRMAVAAPPVMRYANCDRIVGIARPPEVPPPGADPVSTA